MRKNQILIVKTRMKIIVRKIYKAYLRIDLKRRLGTSQKGNRQKKKKSKGKEKQLQKKRKKLLKIQLNLRLNLLIKNISI